MYSITKTHRDNHLPVFVSSTDIHHATSRTLQMKHTCTNSISLLLRTLKILVIIFFFDMLQLCSSSVVVCGGVIFCKSRSEATQMAGTAGNQARDEVLLMSSARPGCLHAFALMLYYWKNCVLLRENANYNQLELITGHFWTVCSRASQLSGDNKTKNHIFFGIKSKHNAGRARWTVISWNI